MGSPKYIQVMDYLKEECKDKEPHSPVPSEREIAAQLGMSRMTVRKAVEELCRQGVLYREGNKGTFVSAITPSSFSSGDDQERRRILFMDSVYDGSNAREVQDALGLQEHERLFRLVRLVLHKDIPLRVEEIYAAEHDVSDDDLGNLDSFLNLEQYKNAGRVSSRICPVLIPVKYVRLLQLKPNTPVIRKDEMISRQNGRPYIFIQTYFNPDTSPL